MKKTLVIVLAVALVGVSILAAVLGSDAGSVKDELAVSAQALDAAETELATLRAQVEQLTSEKEELTSELETAQSMYEDSRQQLGDLATSAGENETAIQQYLSLIHI